MTDTHVPTPELLTLDEVAQLTRVPIATLRWWRATGRGPKTFKLGGRVLARRADVDSFIDAAFQNAVGA